jgi:hypothetical protein
MMRSKSLVFVFSLLLAGNAFAAAKITIQNSDGTGVGFNDPTPVQPVGGNPGTTVGQQRQNAFARAAEIWGNLIDSPVEIVISASFPDLTCTATSGTLGSAGATQAFANFENAPLKDVWYPVALANKYAGHDLAPAQADIRARFNGKLGQPGCLDSTGGWYYGFDGNHGTKTDLVVVLLHEFAHGLGFSSFTNYRTGELFKGNDTPPMPNAYEIHMVDGPSGKHWGQLTDAERQIAATNDQNLFWAGPQTLVAASKYLGAPAILRVNSPTALARTYNAGSASFGDKVSIGGVTGTIATVEDAAEPAEGETAAGTTSDGCSSFLNASAVVGRIALIDRGRCTFVSKAQNAKAAGAIGVIIVDNRAAAAAPGMSGVERTLGFPVISVTQADGNAIRAELGRGGAVNATIAGDSTQPLAGTNTTGLVKLYAPAELSTGSSVSHWDTTTQPNTLMEPNISDDLDPAGVDITMEQMLDIGWTATTKTPSGRRILRRGH